MALRATGRGVYIHYVTDACCKCGKSFQRPSETRYKRQTLASSGSKGVVFFCSWSCMRAYDEDVARVKEENKRRKSEAQAARWAAWRVRNGKPDYPAPNLADPIAHAQARVEYYTALAEHMPKGTKERHNAMSVRSKWQRKLRKLKGEQENVQG